KLNPAITGGGFTEKPGSDAGGHIYLAASACAVSNRKPAAIYCAAAIAIATPNPVCVAIHPLITGADPPPIQPTIFMNPAAVPRASSGTTSNIDAKMFASYIPLKNPQAVRATMRTAVDFVKPQRTTKGAPANTPIACTSARLPSRS